MFTPNSQGLPQNQVAYEVLILPHSHLSLHPLWSPRLSRTVKSLRFYHPYNLSQPATISWMLGEHTRLDHRQRILLLTALAVTGSQHLCQFCKPQLPWAIQRRPDDTYTCGRLCYKRETLSLRHSDLL